MKNLKRQVSLKMINSFTGKYEFLSNFYPASVDFEDCTYPTVEHAYQAAKTLDAKEREEICVAPTPAKAKRLGQKVTLRPDWEKCKSYVMMQLVTQKFSTEPLRTMLLETGDKIIVEGNHWHDNFWGNCQCDDCLNIEGKNTLGKILMLVRHNLRAHFPIADRISGWNSATEVMYMCPRCNTSFAILGSQINYCFSCGLPIKWNVIQKISPSISNLYFNDQHSQIDNTLFNQKVILTMIDVLNKKLNLVSSIELTDNDALSKIILSNPLLKK